MPDDSAPAGAPDLERKLLTILSADVAEYSRLMAENEEETLRVFREHKQVFDSLVALHRGRIFNTAGDAILAEFTSAVEAVRCATEIQAALRTRNDLMPPTRQVRFRIGVNLGDVMVHGNDLMGDGVNVAARLQGAAEPGGICVSGSVYDQIRNKLSLSFKPLGEKAFKNIPQPVRTFAISEAEGIGVLPAPDAHARRGNRRHRWIVAAAIVLVALGGGWWTWAESERARVEQARLVAQAEAAKQEAAKRESEVLALRQAAEGEARRRAEAERQAAERQAAERQAAEAARREAELAAQRAAAEEAARQAAAERQKLEAERHAADAARVQAEAERRRAEAAVQQAVRASASGFDGKYSGPVCLGPWESEAAFCFRAEGTIDKGKIAADWPGREGRTNTLRGAVTEGGEIVMRWVTRRPDGSVYGAVDLEGTIRSGKFEAAGNYSTSRRSARFDWRKE